MASGLPAEILAKILKVILGGGVAATGYTGAATRRPFLHSILSNVPQLLQAAVKSAMGRKLTLPPDHTMSAVIARSAVYEAAVVITLPISQARNSHSTPRQRIIPE